MFKHFTTHHTPRRDQILNLNLINKDIKPAGGSQLYNNAYQNNNFKTMKQLKIFEKRTQSLKQIPLI